MSIWYQMGSENSAELIFHPLPPSAGRGGESCSCRTFPPLEHIQHNFTQGKNAGFLFFSSPDLCEHRTQQQLRSGQGGAQFIAWNTTQHQQSHDGNTDPRQAGARAVRKMSWSSLRSCCIYFVESTTPSPSGNFPCQVLGAICEASPLSPHWPSLQSCLIPEEHPGGGSRFLRKLGAGDEGQCSPKGGC